MISIETIWMAIAVTWGIAIILAGVIGIIKNSLGPPVFVGLFGGLIVVFVMLISMIFFSVSAPTPALTPTPTPAPTPALTQTPIPTPTPTIDRMSFEELCLDKEGGYHKWQEFDQKNWRPKYFWYENGTAVYVNETPKEKVAIIVPVPLPEGELTEEEYIPATVPYWVALKTGDRVNIQGWIAKKEYEGKTIYYLEGVKVEKTGCIDIQDPDFQSVVSAFEEKRSADTDFDELIFWYWYFYVNPANPSNPISPANPISQMWD